MTLRLCGSSAAPLMQRCFVAAALRFVAAALRLVAAKLRCVAAVLSLCAASRSIVVLVAAAAAAAASSVAAPLPPPPPPPPLPLLARTAAAAGTSDRDSVLCRGRCGCHLRAGCGSPGAPPATSSSGARLRDAWRPRGPAVRRGPRGPRPSAARLFSITPRLSMTYITAPMTLQCIAHFANDLRKSLI